MSQSEPSTSIQRISVIVPRSPFTKDTKESAEQCLTALNVENLMKWWPGTPHAPHRDPQKVRAIQRSLDWMRVAQIASYLLQEEIVDAPDLIDRFFREIYEPTKHEPGREWPPRVRRVVGYQRSEYPTFSNVLLHINGASLKRHENHNENRMSDVEAASLEFDEDSSDLNLSVIDGQHRINGAYLAIKIRQETAQEAVWEVPAEIFLDLDPPKSPPQRQAQIFIDVNFYQKKVDRSLVADLFPTARGKREPLDDKERAQDIGRRLMLETGPIVGMIQIPGIRYGVRDVVSLATLNSAIEDVLPTLYRVDLTSLDEQTDFLAMCLEAWLDASGRREDVQPGKRLTSENVAYQGRILVSVLTLVPAILCQIQEAKCAPVSRESKEIVTEWLQGMINRAGLMKEGTFLPRTLFKERGFLGSGGRARFRNILWAASLSKRSVAKKDPEKLAELADKNRREIRESLEECESP